MLYVTMASINAQSTHFIFAGWSPFNSGAYIGYSAPNSTLHSSLYGNWLIRFYDHDNMPRENKDIEFQGELLDWWWLLIEVGTPLLRHV